MRSHIYDCTLNPRERFENPHPGEVHSLPGSSQESSTEPMDTDEGRCMTRRIMDTVCTAYRRPHAGSEGHNPDPMPLGTPVARSEVQRGTGGQLTRGATAAALGRPPEETLLNIPLCVSGEAGGDEEPSLHHPGLVDPINDFDDQRRHRGARPKTRQQFNTQTVGEEAPISGRGTDFFLPLSGQPHISEVRS